MINITLVKASILLYFSFLFPSSLFGQTTNLNCNDVKTGTFYYYSHESKQQYGIIREDSIQKEINFTTNDTSFWRVKWATECLFTIKFIKATRKVSAFERSFANSHVSIIRILAFKKDYYTFIQGLDSLDSTAVTDTIWFNRKDIGLKMNYKGRFHEHD